MISGNYSFAGVVVRVCSCYETVHRLCRDYASLDEPDFCVDITHEDIRREQIRSALQDETEGRPLRHIPEDYLETLAVYREIAEHMLCYDTILFHGSAIALDGEGYLFTAKSGTGKSTHARLWRQVFGSRAVMVNDDKPLLKCMEDGILICGTPWDGKHHLSSNIQVPLKAICVLERGEENRIWEESPKESLPWLLQQSYRPQQPEKLLKAMSLLDRITKNVRLYRLRCNMDPEAAILSHNAMALGRVETDA